VRHAIHGHTDLFLHCSTSYPAARELLAAGHIKWFHRDLPPKAQIGKSGHRDI
jgi:sialic acid synthase SpsE